MKKTTSIFIMSELAFNDDNIYKDTEDFFKQKFIEAYEFFKLVEDKKKHFQYPLLLSKFKNKNFDLIDFLSTALIKFDYNFAKSLNLYDCISPRCFSSDTEFGKEVLKFLINNEICFFVISKAYHSISHIDISFKVSDFHTQFEAIECLTDNKSISYKNHKK
ncbi:hypothetical protein [Flavobacterium sp. N2820]|uniref:hypothetical protein n=1 Tax=Flavobacterium sp. N2820 TaxID=2986834 RepID=UPI002224E812|nr:hypothetical protein [Flavobacterium sp. N2820]